MNYVSATQVKNILAQKGFLRGKKSTHDKKPIDGVATWQSEDGWVSVAYDHSSLNATQLMSMNKLIRFALVIMNGFEEKMSRNETLGLHKEFELLYRKVK